MDELTQRIERLEKILLISDKYLFQKPLVGGPSGLRLGSNAMDKVGFYEGAPVVKYTGVTFNAVPGASYGAPEQGTLAGLRTAFLYYNLIVS